MGKYYTQGDKVLMPLAIQVHHAVCDGFHVGRMRLLLIDPVMTSELHLDLFRTLGCRRAFFIGENPS